MSEPVDLGAIDYHEATTLPIDEKPTLLQYPRIPAEPLGPIAHAVLPIWLRHYAELVADSFPRDAFDPSSWTLGGMAEAGWRDVGTIADDGIVITPHHGGLAPWL